MAKKYDYGHGGETDVISMTDQMHEAKKIVGATKWNNLSDKEKKSLTKYLIMKGDIEGEGEDYYYAKGGMADGGEVNYDEDIAEAKRFIIAFVKKYGHILPMRQDIFIDKLEAQDYLGFGASSFNGYSVSSNIGDKLNVGETKPQRAFIKLSSQINPSGVSGRFDIARTYTVQIEIKGRERVTQRSYYDSGVYFKIYDYGTTIAEALENVEEKMNELERKVRVDYLRFEEIMADGGMMAKGGMMADGGMMSDKDLQSKYARLVFSVDDGETDGKYYVMDAKDGSIVSKGFDTQEEMKVEKYRIFEMTGNPFLIEKKMADGGMMAKGGKPKVIYTQFEEEEFEYADGGKTRGGKFQVGDKVIVNDTGYVTFFHGFDLSKPAVITEKRKVKTSRGIVYTYQIQTADGRKPFNSAIENMLTLAMADGGMMSNNIDDELEAFDLDNLDAFELMQFNRHLKSLGKVGALQILINNVEGDYSQLSTELAELAEKQTSNEEWDKESIRRYGYAHGGKIYVSRRKRTLEERAIEDVGADTWFQLDRETQAGVISEMLSMGALPQRMLKGAKVAKDFSVTYELMDGKKVVEKYGTEQEMDQGIAHFCLNNDVKDAIVAGEEPKVEEVKEVVKEAVVEAKPKKKSIFDTEKAVAKVAKSKQTNPVAHIAGIEREIQKYDELKAIIKKAEAEKEIIGGIIKDLAKQKYLEIYKERGERPTTITIESGGIEITYTPMDKYKTVTPEKETVLREYDNLLGTDYTFTFDNEVLDSEGNNGEKIGDIINDLIENSTDIPDNLKSKVVKMEKKVGVKKGTIKRLLDYDNPSEILTIIEPTITLK